MSNQDYTWGGHDFAGTEEVLPNKYDIFSEFTAQEIADLLTEEGWRKSSVLPRHTFNAERIEIMDIPYDVFMLLPGY